MSQVAFKQVDVFTQQPFRGNPVAVIMDGEGLTDEQMQHIARWTNLSETTFVLPTRSAEASYRLRIFTPMSELPFAGHPSVGTAYALVESGRLNVAGDLLQECEAGLLPVRVERINGMLRVSVRSPAARDITPDDCSHLTAALGVASRGELPARLYNNGPGWWLVELADETTLRAQRPTLAAIAELTRATQAVGLAVFARADGRPDYDYVVRAYCPADGIPEDPVTGSANACIGAYLRDAGRLAAGDRYLASQGRALGRDGLVEVQIEDDGVWIGGHSITVVDGTILLPAC